MKAVVRHRYGGPEVLRLAEVPRPECGEGELLVEVRAVGLNASDVELLTARPLYLRLVGTGFWRPKTAILGSDIAGRVVEVGRQVCGFRPGDEVLADTLYHGMGGLAEYVAVPADAPVAAKPAGLGFEEAAAIPQAAVIALQGLRGRRSRDGGSLDRGVREGQRVLINGAGGGSGSFAVQLAKTAGAEVTAVDRASKLEMLRALGADRVVDFERQDPTADGGPYDLVLDMAAHRSLLDYRRVLAPEGTYAMIGGSMAALLRAAVLGPLVSRRGGRKMGILGIRPNAEDVATAAGLVAEGRLRCVIDRRFDLAEAAAALGYMASGEARGKVVISVRGAGAAPGTQAR